MSSSWGYHMETLVRYCEPVGFDILVVMEHFFINTIYFSSKYMVFSCIFS